VRHAATTFGRGDRELLIDTLRDLDLATTVHPVHTEREFQLDDDGKVGGRYRFTSSAFAQTAQIIAPGLSKLLPEISGSLPLPDERQDLVDGRLAIDLWNKLVDLRFPLFRYHRMIRNEEENTIEGLVGQKHQYLENMTLYNDAVGTLQSYRPDVEMYAAQLLGRRFAVWFRNRAPMFNPSVGGERWPMSYGYYFTNGEATGTSVRGTLSIFTPKGICLGPYKRFGGRVTHTGKDFLSRLGKMFTTVADNDIPEADILSGVKKLDTTSLGFTTGMRNSVRKAAVSKLIHSVSHVGIPHNLAKEIVEEGLAIGNDSGLRSPLQHPGRLLASRTLLDLFVPTLRLARGVDLSRREKIEQAAFDMLIGRFLI